MAQVPTGKIAFGLEKPAPGKLDQRVVEYAGWACSPSGEEFTDVRAVLDGKPFLGLYGLVRPDLVAVFPDSPPARGAGFRVWVRPWLGARTLVFELLDRGYRWREFHRIEIETGGDLPAQRPKPLLPAKFVSESLFQLYRYFHYRRGAEIRREGRRILAEITTDCMVIYPGADLHGVQEIPGHWIHALYDKFRLNGWAFSEARTIRQITASIGPGRDNRLIHGQAREDVATYNPAWPQALKSNFYGLVDIPRDTPSPAALKIFVEYTDGEKVLFFTKRLFLNKQDEHSGPVPVYSEALFWRCTWALLGQVVAGTVKVDDWKELRRQVLQCRRDLQAAMVRKSDRAASAPAASAPAADPFQLWLANNRLSRNLVRLLAADGARLAATGPKISLAVPLYNTPVAYLEELIECVRAQYYPHWELCLADDASPQPHVVRIARAAAEADPRIRLVVRERNGHIAEATNSALDLCTGAFVGLLDHDDLLPPDALLHVAEAIVASPDAGYFYTDEDKINEAGERYDPQFKGAWNPEMAITHNFTHHLSVIRRDLIDRAGRLRPGFTGAQDIDLFLRVFELLRPDQVVHVPFICYHWRSHPESTASHGGQKGYLFDAARRSIAETLVRRDLRASPFLPPLCEKFALCLHQLKWDPALLAENSVTIVIPTRDRADLLQKCLDSVTRTTDRRHVQVIVVDDHSTDAATLALLAALPARTDLDARVLRDDSADGRFSYSRLVNLGTAAASTPLVLHLNNDVEALAPGWLEDMVGWMSVPGVGVVGARLIHPDQTLNHAGIIVGAQGGLADALFAGLPKDDLGPLFLPHCARDVTAVTGACLLTRTDLYRQLGGFDATDFEVAYNDIDYCLRAQAAGFRTVFTPQAVLQHLGSATRGKAYSEREHLAFVRRHGLHHDPYLSEVLEYQPPHLRPRTTDHRYARRPVAMRVLIVTHNLRFEGASLIACDLARWFSRQPGVSVRVVAMEEGPVRREYEEAGLRLDLVDPAPFYGTKAPEKFDDAVAAFARDCDWRECDLVIGNTLASFWAVPVAAALGKSSVLYVHESNPVKAFFAPSLSPFVQPRAEEALRRANRVVFTAHATRRVFENLNSRDNFRVLPTWQDLGAMREFAAAHGRDELRRKHSLDPAATWIANIGSICVRKGQHIFLRAIDHLHKHEPAFFAGRPPVRYLLVGSRPGIYTESLLHDIELLGHKDKFVIVDETREVFDFYRLSDIFVCTSFEESSPRVLIEAATFRLPIISTNVNGIPEMFVDKDEALLLPAGDHLKLAAALKQVLLAVWAGDDKMASMAHSRVHRFFDINQSMPRHLANAREAYLSEPTA